MKKVVLSLAFVAMMFVSCKETETPVVEETAVEVEATPEVVEEVVVDSTVAAEAPAETPAETPAK